MKTRYKPGQEVPRSGQYQMTRGGPERTGVKGKTFPPTQVTGQRFVLVDRTKTK